MKERFDRLDFEPAHELQIIAYANFINDQVQKRTGSITLWINFVPCSKHAWLWSEFIAAPPDPPDPPDIPEVSLDEVQEQIKGIIIIACRIRCYLARTDRLYLARTDRLARARK
jgi:hypothetical protein